LLQATRDIAAGDLGRQVHAEGPAEFTELMASFNLMTLRLRRSTEELATAQRDLAWKEMARQVAHEIRNPLTPMKLAAQHLQRAWRDGAENIGGIIERLTATIIDQVDTLSRISDEFARFARMPRRTVEAVDIAVVLEESVRLFRHHEHATITLRVEAALPSVDADREELGRAVTNILRNAVQALRERGTIHIEAAATSGTVAVRITDDGVGIPEELLGRIFEPNFSTRTEGMGLGLAIVRTIVRDTGGDVTIESAPGKGTVVTLLLPARIEP
jgi:nitrogen fixation/metabolism regulation signal transduction histidine kinase